MNEKIQKMIKKLAKECQKEDIGLSLATIDLEGEATIAQIGEDAMVAIAAHSQYTQVKEALAELDCDCPMHRHLKEMYGIETETTAKNKHTFVTDDPNDLIDILSKISRGEFK
ncbi:TPA: hypothetical protein I0H52_RS13180 [Enterococcus faecalis]|uniref:hypothetical protein n=1 Tax=Enterococcus TaxID=1350 RepID=UPI00053BF2E6|nr:hypothetical protein [Enterococcus faecalis]EGO8273420.1 hypothetical protein [Enterococcus faecalis]KII54371.1 hypothetical protein QR19_03775 [Enterococcus faecalis]HBI2039245.1 hypothetical protein [Enterococcus faecalis]HBI2061747.1 hypothetical protein [Enterococcus faecalis]HBI2079818.1 hypothetical protein [Enterococcus faecalis]